MQRLRAFKLGQKGKSCCSSYCLFVPKASGSNLLIGSLDKRSAIRQNHVSLRVMLDGIPYPSYKPHV